MNCTRCNKESQRLIQGLCGDCFTSEYRRLGGVFNYHSGFGREDLSKGARFKCGIEVEKEDYNVKSELERASLLVDTGWIIESDASLDYESGFEAISPILSIDDFENIKKVKSIIEAKHSSSCGGHIHVSDTKRTPHQILKDIAGYLPLFYAMYPNRINGDYSRASNFTQYRSDSHSQAFNPTERTLEFRIFSSPTSLEVVKWRLRLLKHILTHNRKDPLEVVKDLLNTKSRLYRILLEVYSAEKITQKIILAIKYALLYDESNIIDVSEFSQKIGNVKIKEDIERHIQFNVHRFEHRESSNSI